MTAGGGCPIRPWGPNSKKRRLARLGGGYDPLPPDRFHVSAVEGVELDHMAIGVVDRPLGRVGHDLLTSIGDPT